MKSPTPGVGSETKALQWMKDTLPPNSVIAANWGSGNRINVLGGVKTITDPDHYLQHWIHLYYRHVFCAQSEQEALEFLKTHGATHLMLSEHGILSNAGSYSFIGSDENSDRMFRIHPLERTETTIGSPYRLLPKRYSTTAPFFFLDIVRKDLERLTVSATFENGTHLSKEIHVSHHHDTQTALDFQNGGAILYFNHNEVEHNFRFQKAYSVPAPGWNSFSVKIFFRGEHSDAFVPVYPINSDAPPPIKIWEIHYPLDIQTNAKYLATEPEVPQQSASKK